MITIVTFLLIFSQNNNELRKNTIFNYSIPQKDVIYYSFKTEPDSKSENYKVKFYLQILNNALVFNKVEDFYQSKFEVKLFFKKNSQMIKRQIWVDTITVNEYIKTNLNDYYYETSKNFDLVVDDYEVDIQIFDVNAQKFNESKTILNLKNKIKNQNVIGFSHFLVDDQYSVNQKALPYNRKYSLEVLKLDQSLNLIYLNVIDNKKNILYRRKVQIGHAKRYEVIKIPINFDFPEGDFNIFLYHLAGDTKLKLLERKISIMWWEKPELMYEPNLALRPFRVLLDEEEQQKFDQMSVDERLDYSKLFWEKNNQKKRSNGFNELQYEFYKRVDHVVKKYTNDTFIGWDTDIGKSHLLYGFPIQINQFYKDENKFLKWTYSEFEILFIYNSIQKQFITYSIKEKKE